MTQFCLEKGLHLWEEIDFREMRLVYGQVLEAMLIHTDRSEDVLSQIAYLRKMFQIEDAEHRAIARSLDRQLEKLCTDHLSMNTE